MNVLLEPMPTEWNGYKVNTDFRIGIQIYQASYDEELLPEEKRPTILYLMFADDDGLRGLYPRKITEQDECMRWFLNGWNRDNSRESKEKQRLLDFEVDQWRIYADFMHFYHIDLNAIPAMHWWTFMALLWNMPYRESSFMQVLDIRRKKIDPKMSKEQRKAIAEAKKVYELKQPEQEAEYTSEEKSKIDTFDRMMAERRRKR